MRTTRNGEHGCAPRSLYRRALLAGAPKLKHFSGGHLGLYGSGDYYGGTVSTMEWSLETLRARGVSSDDLLRLPKQQEGIRLQVQGTKDISFFANETVSSAAMPKHTWRACV